MQVSIPKPDLNRSVTPRDLWQLAEAVERLQHLLGHRLEQLQQEITKMKEGQSFGNHV